jgi:tetratricopeptide (TPR) repeat protein
MKNNNRETENNVLSFNQPAEFFVRKAEKHIDAGNFIEALQLYRQVLGMDPHNVEYLLSIAQIYSEMGLYAESNDVLLKIVRYGNAPTECLFALGCNYMGMKKYDLANEAFEQYLAVDPEGEFAEDIDELFDILDEEEGIEDEGSLQDAGKLALLDEAAEGKEHLDHGDYKAAIRRLEHVVKKDPGMLSAMNNLALAYYFEGMKEKAVATASRVIEAQPANLHAICNLALFYSDAGDEARVAIQLGKLETLGEIEPEDMHKVALTYCELGQHEKAYRWLAKIVALQPYDTRILHFTGLAAYNCGLYAEAAAYFVRILKINPKNSIAAYYKAKAEDAKVHGAAKKFEYVYQVQFDEIKRRIKYLNDCLKHKDGSFSEKWKDDPHFKSIILWGLHYGDEYIKKIAIEIMCMFPGEEVEEEFRNFLVKSTEEDDIKNDIFLHLKRMGAKEPYVAYIKGAIAEVQVGSVSEDLKSLPEPYAAALDHFIRVARSRQEDGVITAGVELLVAIAKKKNDKGEWIRKPEALAAAVEYATAQGADHVKAFTQQQVAKVYGVSVGTVSRYLGILYEVMEDGAAD